MPPASAAAQSLPESPLLETYGRVRALSEHLARTLMPEDQVVQTMPDVSPTKWHLAHVTWFFEHFVLQPYLPGYRPFDERWHYLFNSYYYTVGAMHPRPERGLLTRPTVPEILAFRAHVDDAMQRLLASSADDPEVATRVTLGLHHEQQHQELLLTDIKHVFWTNPLGPAYDVQLERPPGVEAPGLEFIPCVGGEVEIGAGDTGFHFDNETPRHRVRLPAHRLANRLVTNADFRDFIDDGGYQDAALWLADGWAHVQGERWQRPLYWSEDLAQEFTLAGWQPILASAPVCHVSFYEADAFARWAGARLPLEAEWETAAAARPIHGNLLESGWLRTAPATQPGLTQLFGDVWEWTGSPYVAYPGFRPLAGSLGEYNGKFMCNQISVRGGSCLTSTDHIRASYRSFFYPHQRWQMLGFRLASDTP
ncbi:ergothioneine biosynthesis protein EgtB [Thioalkalivibrio nitratireducens]|uniref:ergothioneine biosynthesis protein EgtB n=1 Tax=Thioalkalivibrio nitratireducens TaxID=186931 RepID=UPI0002F929C5|nr:ergothioneine biosynthesis protein EgtB [Thioalkalivibrio nitratireducens]